MPETSVDVVPPTERTWGFATARVLITVADTSADGISVARKWANPSGTEISHTPTHQEAL